MTNTRSLHVSRRTFALSEPFVISRGVIADSPTLQVRLRDEEGREGRGEGYGVTYAGETLETMAVQIEAVRAQVEAGAGRDALLTLLPPGGARCALDAALWDLEAKQGLGDPFARNGVEAAPVASGRTLGIRSPDAYEVAAQAFAAYATLKVKVDSRDPLAAVEAVRRGAPDSRLIVDPNQAWSVDALKALAPRMADLGVALLEQPIPVGAEAGLDGYACPVPLCADELIDDIADLDRAVGRFQLVNIKLDKAGGLFAALTLADAAQAMGFGLMVGCMGGSSLGAAPGMVLAQRCAFVDLDGPLMLAQDHAPGFVYRNGVVEQPLVPGLWGWPRPQA